MHYLLYVTYFINVTHAYASGWPLFKTYWLKFRFGITGVKRFFFTKNAVTSSIRLTLPVPLTKGAVSSSLHIRCKRMCPVSLAFFLHSRSRRLCFVSVRFLSSVNISKSYISDMTWPILTRLGHKYRLTIPFMSYDQIGVKGHVGVTGVKKVIFTKKVSSPTGYVAWSRDLCIW